MNIAQLVLKAFWPKAMAFEAATRDPIRAQEKILLEYISRNKNTEYGKKYHFSEVKNTNDYRMLVPMSDSETIFPYVERMAAGEENILTKDRVIFFGLTSGTTGKPKRIPVTNFSRAKKAETMDLWAYYISRDHPRALDGKVLAVINPEEELVTKSGIFCGAESGHAYKNMPWIIKNFYALPYDVFRIQDYESRYYCILRIGMEHDITTIATLNPSTIVLLCQKIEKYKERIIEDIGQGAIYSGLDIPSDIRISLQKALRPNPKRAAELKEILKKEGRLLPKYFWPRMELIECWKGGTVKLHLKELPQYFGDVPVRDFGCLSTEARSSIPTSDAGAGGVLAVNTNFYEFVPREDMGKARRKFLLCNELEKGREYFLIVTTPGGLYRYNIDDIITVNGFFNRAPVIEFVQKGLNAVSIMGEKLYESQVDEAVNRAIDKHKLVIAFFSAAAEQDKTRYAFLVEFDKEPSAGEKKALLESIEKELRKENSEYEYVRKSQLLAPPILKIVTRGEYEKYRVKKVREGANDSQLKVPELTTDPDFQKNFAVEEEIRME